MLQWSFADEGGVVDHVSRLNSRYQGFPLRIVELNKELGHKSTKHCMKRHVTMVFQDYIG